MQRRFITEEQIEQRKSETINILNESLVASIELLNLFKENKENEEKSIDKFYKVFYDYSDNLRDVGERYHLFIPEKDLKFLKSRHVECYSLAETSLIIACAKSERFLKIAEDITNSTDNSFFDAVNSYKNKK